MHQKTTNSKKATQGIGKKKKLQTVLSDEELRSRIYKELQLNNQPHPKLNVKNGQRTSIDISSKKVCKWHISTSKGPQHH